MSALPPIADTLNLELTVSYWDVDRDERLLLPAVFKLLQEAAIKHADQFDAGARAMVTRGESWVLNRVAAVINRYPNYEEALRIETWSSGIRGFKGFRDFRIHAGNEPIASASSLWLYVALKTRSLTRVPEAIAQAFPSRPGAVFHPDLDKLKLAPPGPSAPHRTRVSIRYSDVDGNGHVNNTAYLDYLQTALVRAGLPPRPARLEIQFVKEIAPGSDAVDVCLAAQDGATSFSVGGGADLFAQGRVY